MPPGIWIVLAIFGFLISKKNLRLAKLTIFFAITMIWLTSTSFFASCLFVAVDPIMNWPQSVKISELNSSSIKNSPGAIVVLGGGRRFRADFPEYGQQDLQAASFERVRLAAKLAKKTGLPVLVTGGVTGDVRLNVEAHSEAAIMSQVLVSEFGIHAKWLENQAMSTDENAAYSASILKKNNIRHIYLVTHATHIPRARYFFQRSGIDITAIPVGFDMANGVNVKSFYPNHVNDTRQIWHELMGTIWAQMKSN